jgi:hypothetical protein
VKELWENTAHEDLKQLFTPQNRDQNPFWDDEEPQQLGVTVIKTLSFVYMIEYAQYLPIIDPFGLVVGHLKV